MNADERATFLPPPPEDAAVRALYDAEREADGYVMNLAQLWAWRVDVHEAFTAARKLLASNTALTPRELAVLNAATAGSRRDPYCSLAWGTRLAHLSDAGTAASVLHGDEPPALTERERALVAWARAVTADANGTTPEQIAALRATGFGEREIVDATLTIAFRMAFSTFNAALGARPDAELRAEAPAEVRAAAPSVLR